MVPAIVVFIGAGCGGMLRHGVNLLVPRLLGMGFPFATFFINITGSFLMGAAASFFVLRFGEGLPQHLRLFLTTGLLGGYTTFSTFSLDFALLVERGELTHALFYAVGSVVLSLLAVFAGLSLIRAFA